MLAIRWEFKVIKMPPMVSDADELGAMSDMGEEGWEPFGVTQGISERRIYFKRPKS